MSQKRNKDFSKLEEIYHSMKVSLYKYAYSIVKNSSDAEDVLQTSIANFIDAFDRICNLSEPALRSYLKKTVHNESISLVRARHDNLNIDDCQVSDEKNDVANLVIKRLEYEEALKIVQELKPKHSLYINLKYFQNLSDDSIAHLLGVKCDSLRMIAYRARLELIEKANKKGGVF